MFSGYAEITARQQHDNSTWRKYVSTSRNRDQLIGGKPGTCGEAHGHRQQQFKQLIQFCGHHLVE